MTHLYVCNFVVFACSLFLLDMVYFRCVWSVLSSVLLNAKLKKMNSSIMSRFAFLCNLITFDFHANRTEINDFLIELH